MLTRRVAGSGVSIHCASFRPKASELLIEKPPPRTPNLPPTDGSASTAAAALPPLRLRSRPQPQRTSAGGRLHVEIGEASQRRRLDRRLRPRRARSSTARRPRGAVRRRGCVGEKRAVGVPLFEHDAVQRQRDDEVRAGAHGKVQVGFLGERGRARVDHDERRAGGLRLLDERESGGCRTRTG